MKVIILGACGGMGRYVAKSISSFQEIDNLGIADLNSEDATNSLVVSRCCQCLK